MNLNHIIVQVLSFWFQLATGKFPYKHVCIHSYLDLKHCYIDSMLHQYGINITLDLFFFCFRILKR